jgi:hypothetical protein
MINKSGISGVVKNLSIPQKKNNSNNSNTSIIGRVVDIILDENHPKYNELGLGPAGIGVIFFSNVGNDNIGTIKIAKPYFPNIKNYPLVNEFIYCFYLPTPTLSTNTNLKRDYYYLTNFNLWNNPHFNALPPGIKQNNQSQNSLGYTQTENGAPNITPEQSNTISPNSPDNPSQNTFIEKANIHPLMPFAGDIIYEGRFGNSIRFGNTSKSKSTFANSWSTSGENGDPVTILRNGQPKQSSNDGWVPITENIKNDLSSIWLTSTQKVPISLANENFLSYTTPPLTPSSFILPQIILNSDRIILNAKSDSVLISGDKSVGISSNGNINMESPSHYIDSNDIKLGSKDATQPVLKGDDTVNLLIQLVTEIRNISKVLETSQIYPSGVATPDAATQMVTQLATKNLNSILNKLEDNVTGIKSNFVKVK